MIFSNLKSFFAEFRRQPLRTFLTMSGVVWGTFTIVLLVAFGRSIGDKVMESMRGLGSSIVIVWPGRTTVDYKGSPKGKLIRITPREVIKMGRLVKEVAVSTPEFIRGTKVKWKKKRIGTSIRGVEPIFAKIRNTPTGKGRFINDLDVKNRRRVCFIGNKLAEDIFGKEEPLGKEIMVGKFPFLVVGVMSDKLQDSNYGGNRDKDCVFIPYTSFMALYGNKYVRNFIYKPVNPKQSKKSIKVVNKYFSSVYNYSPDDKEALDSWDFSDFEKSVGGFFDAFAVFMGIIGACTLLVGGIGVASIMQVVVEERIREIGLKMAVGCTKRRILLSFFAEAQILILSGGLIGFFFAFIVLKLIPVSLIKDFMGIPKIDPFVGLTTILVLLFIGTLSGIIPARRAAQTDPVVALRS